MRIISIDPPEPGTCRGCSSRVLIRPIHIGTYRADLCALCRRWLRDALTQVATATRDALREEARADAA